MNRREAALRQWQQRRDAPHAAAQSPEMDYGDTLPWTPAGPRRRLRGSTALMLVLAFIVAGILVYVFALGGGH